MEKPLKQCKFLFRRSVGDFGLLVCFTGSMTKSKRHEPGSPSSSSKDEFFSDEDADLGVFTTDSSSDADMNKAPAGKLEKSGTNYTLMPLSDQSTTPAKNTDSEAKEESFVFSPPALNDDVVESPSFRTLSDPLLSVFSYDCASGAKASVRISVSKSAGSRRFGGRPQPLPRPVSNSKTYENVVKPVWLPLPEPQIVTCSSDSTSSSSKLRINFDAGSFVSTSPNKSSAPSGLSEVGSGSNQLRKKCTRGGLPLPSPSVATKLVPGIESYNFRELLDATHEFAPECCIEKGELGEVYRVWMKDRASELGLKKETVVFRLTANDNQTLKNWKSDIQVLAQLPETNLCRIEGYCAHEDVTSDQVKRIERLLVFEHHPNGNLHDYLCGIRSTTQLDWSMRIGIILGAARGLLYLHDRAPVQVLYREFKASNVLLDKDFTPRLAGYGLTVASLPADQKFPFQTMKKMSQAHAKRNVHSFGIVLLELLTGKYSRDASFMGDEKNLVRWAGPFLKDDAKLQLILDPRIKAKCPLKEALKLAELALQCLKKKEVHRPSMSKVVDTLKTIKDNSSYNSDHSSKSKEKRRATFGGISFKEFHHGSEVAGGC